MPSACLIAWKISLFSLFRDFRVNMSLLEFETRSAKEDRVANLLPTFTV